MNSENAIEVKNISKQFKVYLDRGQTLKEFSLFRGRRRFEHRQVLKDISFEVRKGEAIALVGRNGCGKSTTLKMLSRIMYPDSGTIEMSGRVSSLIELGAGFHPDMTGRENIYINASIFGLNRAEIDRRLESIIDFSELEDFIDSPVRTYSSGMYMRLAFSVAINVDADILLIDEILAVGDAGFQGKCFNRLREIKASGTTIVIVSHALSQIEQICDRSLWIEEGVVRFEGNPRDVNLEYVALINREQKRRQKIAAGIIDEDDEDIPENRYGSREVVMTELTLTGGDGEPSSHFETGEAIKIDVKYKVREPIDDAVFGFGIFRIDGLECYGTNTDIERFDKFDLHEDGGFTIYIDDLSLVAGKYWIDVTIEKRGGIPVDYYKQAFHIDVTTTMTDVGVSRIPHKFDF